MLKKPSAPSLITCQKPSAPSLITCPSQHQQLIHSMSFSSSFASLPDLPATTSDANALTISDSTTCPLLPPSNPFKAYRKHYNIQKGKYRFFRSDLNVVVTPQGHLDYNQDRIEKTKIYHPSAVWPKNSSLHAYLVAVDGSKICWIDQTHDPTTVLIASLSSTISTTLVASHSLAHSDALGLLLTNGLGKLLAFDESSTVYVWDLTTLVKVYTIDTTAQLGRMISMNVTGSKLVAGGENGAVGVWDIEKGIELFVYNPPSHTDTTRPLNVGIHENLVFYGMRNGKYKCINLETGLIVSEYDITLPLQQNTTIQQNDQQNEQQIQDEEEEDKTHVPQFLTNPAELALFQPHHDLDFSQFLTSSSLTSAHDRSLIQQQQQSNRDQDDETSTDNDEDGQDIQVPLDIATADNDFQVGHVEQLVDDPPVNEDDNQQQEERRGRLQQQLDELGQDMEEFERHFLDRQVELNHELVAIQEMMDQQDNQQNEQPEIVVIPRTLALNSHVLLTNSQRPSPFFEEHETVSDPLRGTIQVWDTRTFQRLYCLSEKNAIDLLKSQVPHTIQPSDFTSEIWLAEMSRDSSLIYATADVDHNDGMQDGGTGRVRLLVWDFEVERKGLLCSQIKLCRDFNSIERGIDVWALCRTQS